MAILVNRRSRVITQGVTGDAACRRYAKGKRCFVADVSAWQAGVSLDGAPIFATVSEARARTGATVSMVGGPPALAAAAIEESIDAGIELVVCLSEGIPLDDVIRVRRRLVGSRTLLLGPGCAGVITPGEINVGVMPGDLYSRGRIGVISRSGALTGEAARQLAAFDLGQSTVVALGDDPLGGLQPIDVLKMFDDDLGTDAVLMVGDGADNGDADEACAHWIANHMSKPVVGLVAGDNDGAQRTFRAMQACGIPVTRNPAAMGELVAAAVAPQWLPFD